MFRKKQRLTYDTESQSPVIRASICNGEQVAGFEDKRTGIFTEIMLIRDDKDLREFTEMYGISVSEIKKKY